MNCPTLAKNSLEGQVVELISMYGALLFKQVSLYFNLSEGMMCKILKSLSKKSRIYFQNNYVLINKDSGIEQEKIVCFWVLLDLIDEVSFHYTGSYPLIMAIYTDSHIYELYYCEKGDEIVLSHAINFTKNSAKTLIVVNEVGQIPKIDVKNAVFCTVSSEGVINYYECE